MSDRITVIHAPRDSDHQYFALARAVPQDERLSFEARGLLTYLLSKPADWQIQIADLQREGGCGRDRIYRLLKELRDAGYVQRERIHQPNGAFVWGPYRVYEIPFPENAEMVQEMRAKQPFPEKPDTAQPDTENAEMATKDIPHQKAAQPFSSLPYTENTDAYIIENNTDQRILQKRERTNAGASAPRAPRPPKQVNLSFVHDAVVLYRKLTGIRSVAPAMADRIAEIVIDLPAWETAVSNWIAAGFKLGNIGGMLDWYLHPDKQKRATPNAPKPEPKREYYQSQAHKYMQPDELRAALNTEMAKRGKIRSIGDA